ncbi:MAG TPA: carboxyl transferase domain-containing protein [Mycobacteriales bacterium]|nr:carboxyl transferase domain-containing protein [Mycobacteriales bacterium]
MSDDEERLPAWSEALASARDELPSSDVLHCSVATVSTHSCVLVRWDFGRQGGTFGVAEAAVFESATRTAIEARLPLVTITRSGGTRLPEGMRALVGIPRAALALSDLRAAGLPHLSVADNPTTGGVWVAIGTQADLRFAISGGVVAFSGPRVVPVMTGRELAPGSNTAEAAYDAGLVDAIGSHDDAGAWLATALTALSAETSDKHEALETPSAASPPQADGAEQFAATRKVTRPSGNDLIDQLLTNRVELRSSDDATRAVIGRLSGRRVVAVALAARRGGMPAPAGFGLLGRAARLAGALDLALITLIDTPGADPHTEAAGLSAAIAAAMTEVLVTPAPTVALLHGEGGSGGALAAATVDLLGVGEHGWFGALGPDGAAAALRSTPAEAARLMRITPQELVEDGVADAFVATGGAAGWIAAAIDVLRRDQTEQRLARRRGRWSSPLPEIG